MHMLLFCSVISCDLKITAAAAAMNSVEGAGEGEQGVLRQVQAVDIREEKRKHLLAQQH